MNVTDWIDAANARADAATDGPWEIEHGRIWSNADIFAFNNQIASMSGSRPWMSDAEFIAASRTDLPKALDALRAVLDLMAVADADAKWVPSDPSVGYIPTNHLQRAIASALGVQP